MNAVVEWLESPPGWKWARGHFSDEESYSHDMIEIVDDYISDAIYDHSAQSTSEQLSRLKESVPQWADLDWTPDQPPDRVLQMHQV